MMQQQRRVACNVATTRAPSVRRLLQSYGIESFRCDNVDDLPAAVERFVNAKGPVLVDFGVVPDICLPMVAPGKGLDEMFMPGDISLDDEVQRGLSVIIAVIKC